MLGYQVKLCSSVAKWYEHKYVSEQKLTSTETLPLWVRGGGSDNPGKHPLAIAHHVVFRNCMLSQSIDQYSFNKSCQTPLKSVTIYSYKSSWGGRVLQTLRQYLSLHFNGNFPGEPGLAGVY